MTHRNAGATTCVLLSAGTSRMAAGLGIPLDGFIGTFETFVTGLGLAGGAGRSDRLRG